MAAAAEVVFEGELQGGVGAVGDEGARGARGMPCRGRVELAGTRVRRWCVEGEAVEGVEGV
ncbi:MAG: hypothetical protein ABIQ61_05720, partial [Ornithinibacter sp.]